MSKKQIKPDGRTGNGGVQKERYTKAREAITSMVNYNPKSLANLKTPIPVEDLDMALYMLAEGELMSNVCERLGLSRYSLTVHGRSNPEFGHQLRTAQEIGAEADVDFMKQVAIGTEGYSTGDIARDRLICELYWKVAKAVNKDKYGDLIKVDQRSVSITLDKDDANW